MKHLKQLPLVICSCLLPLGFCSLSWGQSVPSQGQQANQASSAKSPANYAYNGINRTPWFASPGVRDQLKWNDSQYQQMNRNYGEAWNRYSQNLGSVDHSVAEQERLQRQRELSRNFHHDYTQTMTEVLSDPAARDRYNQLYLQYRGYGAFNDPLIDKQLNLTPAQRVRFHEYDRDWNRDMNTWHREYPTNSAEVLKQFNQSRSEYQQRVKSTLTPDQRRTWDDLSGKPYSFTPDAYFFHGVNTNEAPAAAVK